MAKKKERVSFENSVNKIPAIVEKLGLTTNKARKSKNDEVKYRLAEVNPADINIDHNVQRDPDIAHLTYLADNFNMYYAKPLVLCEDASGNLYAPDTQHTACAFYLNGFEKAPAIIYQLPFNTVEQNRKFMANMFNYLNKVKPLNVYTKLKNEAIAGTPSAVRIFEVANETGCTLVQSKSKKAGAISHIAYVKKIHNEFGEDILRESFSFMRKYWSGEAIGAPILIAVARFFFTLKKKRDNPHINATADYDMVFAALTKGETILDQEKVNKYLEGFQSTTSAKGTSYDILKSRAIFYHYNGLAKKAGKTLLDTNGVL